MKKMANGGMAEMMKKRGMGHGLGGGAGRGNWRERMQSRIEGFRQKMADNPEMKERMEAKIAKFQSRLDSPKMERKSFGGYMPVRGGGGVPLQGPGGRPMRPERPEHKKAAAGKRAMGMKAGGMVRGAGCAKRGLKISKKMG